MARLRASQREEQREAVRQTAQLAMRNRRTNRTDQQRDNLRRARRNASSVDFNRVAFQLTTARILWFELAQWRLCATIAVH
jgi:hypothetical protein